MAQKSKRNYIVEIALPLFLEHGFKGTSIDLVVKQSGVSKPTVYNHFPDKAALMLAVVQNYRETQQPFTGVIDNYEKLEKTIKNNWLNNDTVKLYAVVIGEGRRFEEAKQFFWENFDNTWRQSFAESTKPSMLDKTSDLDCLLDQQLLHRLKQL